MAGTATAGAAGPRPTTSSASRPAAGSPSGRTTTTPCGRATRRSRSVGFGRDDPPGGVVRRAADGSPEGVLYESATRLVTIHVPPPSQDDLAAAIEDVGRRLVALGVVACHDPGGVAPDPDLTYAYPVYARLADAGDLPLRVHACMRDDGVATAIERGLRSGAVLGDDPDGRARVGWQKCFADGSLGSRTAALLEDIEPEPDRPVAPERRRGVWMTDRDGLIERVARATAGGITTQIHAIGDAAVRVALDVLAPGADEPAAHAPHRARPDAPPRRPRPGSRRPASRRRVQPVHLGSDAAQARRLWGARAEAEAYTWRSIAETGAVMAFGTDAPVESFDPWPGLALAVRREDPRWPAGTAPYAPEQALTLDRALRANCVDPALSARETGPRPPHGRPARRRRRDPGRRASMSRSRPAAPLSTTRPVLVMIDGDVVFEV